MIGDRPESNAADAAPSDPMEYKFRTIIQDSAGRSLAERARWYSAAAAAYDRVRPRYPDVLLDTVAELTGLQPGDRLLEVGCGPGTATVDLAKRGYQLDSLEPNPEAWAIASHNCAPYPHVHLHNATFEEWTLPPDPYAGVVAASSFHWIPAEIAYPKAAQALSPSGHLVLMWNKQMQPAMDIYRSLQPIYQQYAPHLDDYESPEEQYQMLDILGQGVQAAAAFEQVMLHHWWIDVTYAVADYLLLLSTYSPYIALAPERRSTLLTALGDRLQAVVGTTVELRFLAAVHTARVAVSSGR